MDTKELPRVPVYRLNIGDTVWYSTFKHSKRQPRWHVDDIYRSKSGEVHLTLWRQSETSNGKYHYKLSIILMKDEEVFAICY